jgi:hypothetical protein
MFALTCLAWQVPSTDSGLSAEIAQLFLDADDDESDKEPVSTKDKPGPSYSDERPQTPTFQHQGPTRRKRRLQRFTKDLANLLASDFTRDLLVIVETNSSEPAERFQYVPLRNKIDTDSDGNFISHKILKLYGVNEEKIRAIPEEEQKEREFVMIGGYKLRPQREITLDWYRPKEPKKRQTTFIIAENDPPI